MIELSIVWSEAGAMKASEVLKRYAEGRRDFRGESLRGQSFKGKDLSGADFSEADIRGAKFTKANLRGTKFSEAKAGLQKRWAIVLVIVAWLFSGISGIFLGFIGYLVALIFDSSNTENQISGWIVLVVLIVFFFITIRQGIVAGLGAFAVAGALLCAYLGWRAMKGDPRDAWIRSFAIAFAAISGTSFRGADLTDADFRGATLKSTDLRKATIVGTNWHKSKKLDRARVGNTILIDSEVRDLVVTHRGAKKSYVRNILKGANLVDADLSDANLTEADISGANLQGAWLERANLTKTQALKTNFNQAKLTGACLEAWNIDSTTKLEGAICDYVYLLNNQKERRPSSGDFAPGEFTKLFEEVLNTVDLIFRNGLDWKAFAAAFKKVQVENEDTELAIQSIENKGDGVVVVKVNVPLDANKEKIHAEFTQNYELALKAVEEKYKEKLQAKDEQIEIYRQQSSKMTEIVSQMASRPINNIIDIKATADSKSMNKSTDQSRKIEIGDIGGDFNASGSALNLGNISGTVTNTINELPASPEPDKPGIKELLAQLQEVIEAETSLNDQDKAEALEQVKVLAEAGKNPSDGAMKKLAKRATTMLKGIISGLPDTVKLVEQCKELLPMITSLF